MGPESSRRLCLRLSANPFQMRTQRDSDWTGVQWPVARNSRLHLEILRVFSVQVIDNAKVIDNVGPGISNPPAFSFLSSRSTICSDCLLFEYPVSFAVPVPSLAAINDMRMIFMHAVCVSAVQLRNLKGRSCYGFFAFSVFLQHLLQTLL